MIQTQEKMSGDFAHVYTHAPWALFSRGNVARVQCLSYSIHFSFAQYFILHMHIFVFCVWALSLGKSTLLVTYTAYNEMCSLHLIHPWGAVGSHSTAPGDQLQILSQYLGQG